MSANHSKKSSYRNPPRDTRFKKGQSGNPSGRPKDRPNLATVLERTLRETVVITENGRRQTITKLEAATRQLVDKAASGDLRALQQLIALARSAEERSPEAGAPIGAMAEIDRKVLEGVLSRIAKIG